MSYLYCHVMKNDVVGGASRLLSETRALVVAESETRERLATMIFDEWRVTATTAPEELRSTLPRVDVIVLTDRSCSDSVGRTIAHRDRHHHDGEAILGVERDGEGFGDVSPDVVIESPPDPAEVRTTLRRLRTRSAYDGALREYYALADCLAAMESNRCADALEGDPVYERVSNAASRQADRVEDLREALLGLGADVAFAPPDGTRPTAPENYRH